jgi:lipopolysaccharide transport system permease protein
MLAVYRFVPPWTAVLLPLLLIPTILLAAGMAYLLSALTVTYRDFRFIIQFMAQLWMWVSFVMFPVPGSWLDKPKFQFLFYLNPMYGQVTAYRKALLGLDHGWNPRHFACSVVLSVAVFFLGIFYFRRTERRFADIA